MTTADLMLRYWHQFAPAVLACGGDVALEDALGPGLKAVRARYLALAHEHSELPDIWIGGVP